MGLMDDVKAALGPAREKVTDLARKHGDKVQHGLDKAARVVDEQTKGKYTDKIHAGTDKAREAVDRLAHQDAGHRDAGHRDAGHPAAAHQDAAHQDAAHPEGKPTATGPEGPGGPGGPGGPAKEAPRQGGAPTGGAGTFDDTFVRPETPADRPEGPPPAS